VRRPLALLMMLLAVEAWDEMGSGVPLLSVPDIQAAFAVAPGLTAGALLAIIQLAACLVEPPLFILADRWPRKRFVVGGLVVLGLAALAAAAAHAFWIVLVALAAWGPAGGSAIGVSQMVLMDARPDERERSMAQWVIAGTIGDMTSPIMLASLAWAGFGWRAGFVTAGVLALALAAWAAATPFPARIPSAPVEGPTESVLGAMRSALRERRLVAWSLGIACCALLDEILVAFAALRLRDLGLDVAARNVVMAALMAGFIAGAVGLERCVAGRDPLRLLAACGAACVASYVAWLFATGPVTAALSLAAVGLTSAPLYPIVKAQAYRALPDRAGAVNAVRGLFLPLEMLAPLALGAVADRFGVLAALSLLLLQPIALLLLAAWAASRREPA
jgi:MFS family permease